MHKELINNSYMNNAMCVSVKLVLNYKFLLDYETNSFY